MPNIFTEENEDEEWLGIESPDFHETLAATRMPSRYAMYELQGRDDELRRHHQEHKTGIRYVRKIRQPLARFSGDKDHS